MIFGLLNVRKKTSAVIAGIAIGAAFLWGLAMWQDIPRQELFNIFFGVLIMLLGIMAVAITIAGVFTLIRKILSSKDPE